MAVAAGDFQQFFQLGGVFFAVIQVPQTNQHHGARHQQAEQFDQDMQQMQKLGGLDNYLKYKDASKCNQ